MDTRVFHKLVSYTYVVLYDRFKYKIFPIQSVIIHFIRVQVKCYSIYFRIKIILCFLQPQDFVYNNITINDEIKTLV